MNDVTRILNAIESGDRKAAGQLLPLVYDELRKLAAHKLARERAGQTLQPTALVHEAYLRLVGPMDDEALGESRPFLCGRRGGDAPDSRGGRARKKRLRHGGELERAAISIANLTAPASLDEDLVAIDEALATPCGGRCSSRPARQTALFRGAYHGGDSQRARRLGAKGL